MKLPSLPGGKRGRFKSNKVLHAIFASIHYEFAQDLRGDIR